MHCNCNMVKKEKSKWAAQKIVDSMYYLHKVPVFAEEVDEKNGEIYYRIIGVNNTTKNCQIHWPVVIFNNSHKIIYKKGL